MHVLKEVKSLPVTNAGVSFTSFNFFFVSFTKYMDRKISESGVTLPSNRKPPEYL